MWLTFTFDLAWRPGAQIQFNAHFELTNDSSKTIENEIQQNGNLGHLQVQNVLSTCFSGI